MRFAIALALALLLAGSRPVDACTWPIQRGVVGAPAFEPAGAVTIASEDVAVACSADYTCTVTSTFAIAVTQPARATVIGYHAIELTLSASGRTASPSPVGSADPALFENRSATRIELAPADTQLVLRARVVLPDYFDGCFTDGIIARHRFLASRRAGHQRILQIDTTRPPRIEAPDSWSVDVDAHAATKHDPASTWLWFEVPRRLVTHGGPVLMLGAASGEGGRFRARAVWEVAIARPWLVFALAGETDFADRWNLALTVEPTNQAYVLSFGLGAGFVFANNINGVQLGGRGQLSIAYRAARAVLSLDALVVDARTELTLVGLLGVGL
jgi:hypothetical protein